MLKIECGVKVIECGVGRIECGVKGVECGGECGVFANARQSVYAHRVNRDSDATRVCFEFQDSSFMDSCRIRNGPLIGCALYAYR